MTRVFISYRRADSKYVTNSIYRALTSHYGKDNVFFDVVGIEPGMHWRQALVDAVESCDVLLIIIGPEWIGAGSENGPRLAEANDPVRVEIETGLTRPDIRVIPVLVKDAHMPPRAQLPDTLQELTYRNAVSIRDMPEFDRDVEWLIEKIDEGSIGDGRKLREEMNAETQVTGLKRSEPSTEEKGGLPSFLLPVIAIVLMAVIAFIVIASLGGNREDADATSTAVAIANAPTDTDVPPSDTPIPPTDTPTETNIPPTDTVEPTETTDNSAQVVVTEEPTNTPEPSATDTPVPTATDTEIPTDTPTPTATDTDIPTNTPTPTATDTPTSTFTPSATNTDIPTDTPTPTATDTETPTNTPTSTETPLPPINAPYIIDFEDASVLDGWVYTPGEWNLVQFGGSTVLERSGGVDAPMIIAGERSPGWTQSAPGDLVIKLRFYLDSSSSGVRVVFNHSEKGYHVLEFLQGTVNLKRNDTPPDLMDRDGEQPIRIKTGVDIGIDEWHEATIWANTQMITVYIDDNLVMMEDDFFIPTLRELVPGDVILQTISPPWPTYIDDLSILRTASGSTHFSQNYLPNSWFTNTPNAVRMVSKGSDNYVLSLRNTADAGFIIDSVSNLDIYCRVQNDQGGFKMRLMNGPTESFDMTFTLGNLEFSQTVGDTTSEYATARNFYNYGLEHDIYISIRGTEFLITRDGDARNHPLTLDQPINVTSLMFETSGSDRFQVDDCIVIPFPQGE